MLNFNFNISSWINKILPLQRKTTVNISWLNALLTPLKTAQTDLETLYADLDFKVKFTAQQRVLASLLNKLFDPTDKRIRIATISDLLPEVLVYFDNESPDGHLLYFDSESADGPFINFDSEENEYDFIVYVPTALTADEEKIKAWVRLYSSKPFQIIYF